MENKDFNLIRIVREEVSNINRYKMIGKDALKTKSYFVEFFYKAISRTIGIDELPKENFNNG